MTSVNGNNNYVQSGSFNDFVVVEEQNTVDAKNNDVKGDGGKVSADVKLGTTSFEDDFAVVNMEDVATLGKTAEKLDSGDMKGADLVRGAKLKSVSDDVKTLMRHAKTRSAVHEAITAVGRFLMGAAHVVKSVLCLDVLRPSWWRNNVANYDRKLAENGAPGAKDLTPLPELLKDKNGNPLPKIPFDKNLVATGTGFTVKEKAGKLSGMTETNITVKPFRSKLYPSDHPKLSDIKQNPALQDCWFLSGITATLAAKGSAAIERLIEMREDDGGNTVCDVRLGGRTFTVPYGEVQCDGKSCVSDSAPWVKILEQAAAMYNGTSEVVDTSCDKTQTDIIYGHMNKALSMLSGGGETTSFPSIVAPPSIKTLQNALNKGIPVEIGHGPKGFGHIPGALRDNISPGHAVTLLDIQSRGNGKAWLTVMDPYGHTRIISSSALERCSVCLGCDGRTVRTLENEAE